MDSYSKHLKRLEDGITYSIPHDENGYTGRECPNPDCLGYFKIKFGTGQKGENLPCYCPYCGQFAEHDKFWTQDQIEYLQAIVKNEVNRALAAIVNDWDRDLRRSSQNSFIKFSMKFTGVSHSIREYQEIDLETHVTCEKCTLEYAIYGLFAYCPDCGTHNSVQILKKNLELARKLLKLAEEEQNKDKDLADILVVKALETAVSTFDGFGRAFSNANASKSGDSERAKSLSFQNISKAREAFQTLFGKDFCSFMTDEEWTFTIRCFQKRHLFAHKMGIVDQQYKQIASDKEAVIGRKVKVTNDEVKTLLELLIKMGDQF